MLIDTHCHIHESSYPLDAQEVLVDAFNSGIEKLICVGTTRQSSKEAIQFAGSHDNVFSSIGVHPHDSGKIGEYVEDLIGTDDSIVAVGEIGLDYYYNHSDRASQTDSLERQLQLASDNDMPVIFHVRNAFDDFWPILANFSNTRGVLHSFTDDLVNLKKGLDQGLYIGLNGISTFTKDSQQIKLFTEIPLERVLLETDSPFLTPTPYRGKVNVPSMVREVARINADRRGISLSDISNQTTANAKNLFNL